MTQPMTVNCYAFRPPLYTAAMCLQLACGVNGLLRLCAPLALPPSNGSGRRGVPGQEGIAGKQGVRGLGRKGQRSGKEKRLQQQH